MTCDPIGFIGLGNMGLPMAGRLIDAGYRLVVHDLNEAALQVMERRGAEIAGSPEEVGARVERVMLSLPTPVIVREVCLGEGGLAGAGTVRMVCDLSTTGPRAEQAIAEGLSGAGIDMLDSPVSGGVSGAKKGSLALMVAGKRSLYDEFDPVLAHLGKRFYVGERPGMAQSMKLINNIVSAAALAATSEAMVLGAKSGLDPETMIEVFNAGSGRNSATVDKIPRFVLPRTFDYGFPIGLSVKDIRLCLEESDELGVPMLVGNAVRQLALMTRERFGADADMTALIRTIEDWAGVEVKGRSNEQ